MGTWKCAQLHPVFVCCTLRPPPQRNVPHSALQSYVEATGAQETAYRELAAADAQAAEAIAQRTARLRQLQETLAQVGRQAAAAS